MGTNVVLICQAIPGFSPAARQGKSKTEANLLRCGAGVPVLIRVAQAWVRRLRAPFNHLPVVEGPRDACTRDLFNTLM